MDDTEYADKVEHLKRTIATTDALDFTRDNVKHVELFGNLGVTPAGRSHEITDTLCDLAEHGIIVTGYYQNEETIMYFSAITTEEKTVEKTIETTETQGTLHH